MNTGYMQGSTQTIKLPAGGYIGAPIFAGMGPYSSPDPMMSRIWGNGGGPMGGSMGNLGGAMLGASTQGAYAQSRADNAALADELKTGFQGRYQRGMDMLQGYGSTIDSDVNRIFDERAAKLRRQFSGGMSGNQSTVLARIEAQNERERTDALSRARDQLTRFKLDVDSRLSGDALAQRERMNIGYPDLGTQAAIAGKAGEAAAPLPPEQPQGYGQGGGQPQGGGQGGAKSLTERELKDARRKKSYEDSREIKKKEQAMRVGYKPQPMNVPAAARPAPAPPAAMRPRAPQTTATGPSHSYVPGRGFVPEAPVMAGGGSDRMGYMGGGNDTIAGVPQLPTYPEMRLPGYNPGAVPQVVPSANRPGASLVDQMQTPYGYGGSYDPQPMPGETQEQYLARVQAARARNGLGPVPVNPITGQGVRTR
jgi:hypothetical protein